MSSKGSIVSGNGRVHSSVIPPRSHKAAKSSLPLSRLRPHAIYLRKSSACCQELLEGSGSPEMDSIYSLSLPCRRFVGRGYPLRSYRYNIWAPAVDSGNAAGCGDLRLIAVAAQTGRYSNRLDELERLIATQQGNADGAPSAGRPRLIADRSASTSRGTAASAEDQAASSRGTGR